MADRALTGNQVRFAEEYIAATPRNATAAYRRAYPKSSRAAAEVSAAKLMANPRIAALIQRRERELGAAVGLTQTRLREEMAKVAYSSIDDYRVEPDGRLVPAEGRPPSVMQAVSSCKVIRRFVGDVVEITTEFRLWDKPGVLRLSAQHLGMLDPDTSKTDSILEALVAKSRA